MLDTVPLNVVKKLQNNQLGSALIYVEEQLAQHPDDPGLKGLLGTIRTVGADYSEGERLLQESDGSHFYEAFGIKYHADLLRALGDGNGAAALRAERLVFANLNANREHLDMLGQVKDYRSIGATDDALAVIDQALSLGIRPAYYAAQAEVLMDVGQLQAADESLWLAKRLNFGAVPSLVLAEARLLLLLNDPDAAYTLLESHRRRNMLNLDYWLLTAEIFRARGELMRAGYILNLKRFEHISSPRKQALQASVLHEQGDHQGALALIETALAEAPGNPLLQTVYAQLLEG